MSRRRRAPVAALLLAGLATVAGCGQAGEGTPRPAEHTPGSGEPVAAGDEQPDGDAPAGEQDRTEDEGTPSEAERRPQAGGEDGAAPGEPTTSDEAASPAQATPAHPRPEWLGQRVLPEGPDGFGEVRPTPPELADRRLVTPDHLPPPDSAAFTADISAVPDEVAARSTWSPECPVGLHELRYVTVAFWGFDERVHTGELLVHASVAEDVVGVFRRLHQARFPIEEMRITAAEELDAPPTGDGNNTGAFVCRPSTGSSSWSEHARGLAVDINPFHNPYVKGELVVPELASAYVDRTNHRPGMIQPGDEVVAAFADIGWHWGGDWSSAKDWMHFSQSGK